MKKVFSALIALCMVLSMTAFADVAITHPTDAKIKVTVSKILDDETEEAIGETGEVEVGDTIKVTVETTGDTNGNMTDSEAAGYKGNVYQGGTIIFNYDYNQLEIEEVEDEDVGGDFVFDKHSVSISEGTDKSVTIQATPDTSKSKTAKLYYNSLNDLHGAFVIGSFTATVKEGATGTVKLEFNADDSYIKYVDNVASVKVSSSKYTFDFTGSEYVRTLESPMPTITVKGGASEDPDPVPPTIPTKPTEGIVGELKNVTYVDADKAYTWDLDVTVPIGKVASVNDGTNEPFIVTNGKASGKSPSGSTLTVSYTDAEDAVITYVIPMSKIYGENDGIAAFGKGTIGDSRYGIKFTGLTGTYDGVENYEFDADGNVGGIFAVEVADAPAGDYTAQAYVGTTYGAEISFTK